jgi:flagellar motor switch protein FliN/FliY
VATFNSSVAGFFDHLTGGLEESLSQTQGMKVTISWLPSEARSSDLTWWSCGVSVDAAAQVFAGASNETWEVLGGNPAENNSGAVMQALEQAVQKRFGSQAVCSDSGFVEEPAQDWAGAELNISTALNSYPGLTIVLNPELLAAIGGTAEVGGKLARQTLHSADMLMRVEIPVSVSLGRTQMRMKDLLALSNGSIVELDQQLGDDVEIRVNNCVIARGEVVAVDGNYGVRILKMVSDQGGKDAT